MGLRGSCVNHWNFGEPARRIAYDDFGEPGTPAAREEG
jgi:hypothetical protein